MERLIIDTDPGVDDAEAILMAAAYPEAKIEAILAVNGNVALEHTVRNALTITDVIEEEIPVYAGCAGPLVMRGENAAFVHGQDGLGDTGFRPSYRQAEAEHAAVALTRMVNANPGEMTLVAIGPLTNIAVALKLDPLLPEKLKRFVVMGGAVTSRGNTTNVSAEFNIYADPEGAHVVCEGWAEVGRLIELVDWEATMRHGISAETVNRWLAIDSPRAQFFRAISAETRRFVRERFGRTTMFAADPLAMAVALEPGCVIRSESHFMTIEMCGRYTRGQTTVDWHDRLGQSANAEIILEVDHDRFVTLMEQGLL